MAARQRKAKETFKEYRSSLIAEQLTEDFRLSIAYALRKPTSIHSRVLKALVPNQGQFVRAIASAARKVAARKASKTARLARRYNRNR